MGGKTWWMFWEGIGELSWNRGNGVVDGKYVLATARCRKQWTMAAIMHKGLGGCGGILKFVCARMPSMCCFRPLLRLHTQLA